MSLRVIKPGLQTTLQGAPRLGWRHMGMPWAGAADPVSLGLANRLVGNTSKATALEITYGGFEAVAETPVFIGLAGASAPVEIEGQSVPMHRTLALDAGQVLTIGPVTQGARVYLSVAGGLVGDTVMGTASTYLSAQIGGLAGRSLQAGDRVRSRRQAEPVDIVETPADLRLSFGNSFILRAGISAETDKLAPHSLEAVFSKPFTVGRQSNRMGLRLEGQTLELQSEGLMKSAPVFPGTVQCPENGEPIVLLADAQTTGGYPRIAAIGRVDRHLLGQIRPGARLQLLKRAPEELLEAYRQKTALLRDWMPDFKLY
ncbi:MAG: biotin-dependent carboxyltransferase family protein [Henriciella sp.]|nr:biotin-dependent carboxyltransferase family protein [Henriciella sp.]